MNQRTISIKEVLEDDHVMHNGEIRSVEYMGTHSDRTITLYFRDGTSHKAHRLDAITLVGGVK